MPDTPASSAASEPRITSEVRGAVLLIGLNRPRKMNAFDVDMLRELAGAFTRLERDALLRCAVLFAHGEHFTAGLDLAEVAGYLQAQGRFPFPEDAVDPLGISGQPRTKPVVCAVQGRCLTIGIELLLASDIRIAADNTRFAQIEIKRGIFPFGGATVRLPQLAGWGNAMRYLLTGDEFDAAEALRIGLVQEVVPAGEQVQRALAIAQRVAEQAPLGVQATLASAHLALAQGPQAALRALLPEALRLMRTEDAREGVQSFLERRAGRFSGR